MTTAVDGPDRDVLATMRRIGIVMFVVGAVTAMSVVFTADATQAGQIAQAAVAGGYVVCALALWVSRSRLWPVHASLATSIVLLSVGTATAQPVGLGPMFYLWPLAYAAYFFTPRALILNFVLMVSTLAIALILNPSATLRADTLIRTSVSVGMIAALILFMRLREARLRGELAVLADTDPLTGLLNRRAFDPRLRELAEGAARDRTPLTVALVDVDHFKRVNDERGHLAGDEVLKRVTSVLRMSSSPQDLVVRQGGDEFVVALVGRDLPAALTWARRIADDLRCDAAGAGAMITLSIGVARLDDDARTPDGVLRRADEALYAAKAAGRARTAWWDGAVRIDEPPIGSVVPPPRDTDFRPDDRRDTVRIGAAASGSSD